MQVQTELRPMFTYSYLIIIIPFLLGIVLFIMLILSKKEKVIKEVIIPKPADVISIKNKYLNRLQQLNASLSSNKITSRKAYQELSSLIRNFIFEVTNIQVQNYTLDEIKTVNMPVLYELVSEYYDPEFAIISKGNISSSIEKTRMVIEKWN